MSGFQVIYLGMTIGAFALLMGALAWGQIYSRGAGKRTTTGAKPGEPERRQMG